MLRWSAGGELGTGVCSRPFQEPQLGGRCPISSAGSTLKVPRRSGRRNASESRPGKETRTSWVAKGVCKLDERSQKLEMSVAHACLFAGPSSEPLDVLLGFCAGFHI